MNKYRFDCGCTVDLLNEQIKESDGLPSLHIPYEKLVTDLNYNRGCKDTWNMISTGRTKGVFQLESALGKNWCERLKPDSLEEMSALISIIRPGVLNSMLNGKSLTQHYIDRKFQKEESIAPYKALEQCGMDQTYYILVYQEQIMRICKELAGFSEVEADNIRKGVGKKDAQLLFSMQEKFMEGCDKVGLVTKEEAKGIFDWFKESARYSFNKCVSGKTVLKKSAKGKYSFNPSVEEMFKIRNDINYAKKTGHISLYKKWKLLGNYGKSWSLCDDGRVRPNVIKNIYYQGKMPVYSIILEDNSIIDVTLNHKFPTPQGIKKCSELQVGDILYKCGQYEVSDFTKYNFSNKKNEDRLEQSKIYNIKLQGFQNGKNNVGYINGEYSKFKLNSKLLELKCYQCQIMNVRLEVHHKDGNRQNNNLSNLIRLCCSCHKTAEYMVGRTKRGQKGYPSYELKIKEIKFKKLEDVYDVEMEGPNHNFVIDNDIITSNSHGIGYGATGYITAWTKHHFPLHFFCSWLKYAKYRLDPYEEIRELISEAKLFNIDVRTPSIDDIKKSTDLIIDQDHIKFGFSCIKKIGEAALNKMISEIHNTELSLNKEVKDWSWNEFLIHLAPYITSTTVNGLICGGVLDKFGISRNKMLLDYELIRKLTPKQLEVMKTGDDIISGFNNVYEKVNKNQKQKILDLIQIYENPPTKSNDTIPWIVVQEKELYGVPITYQAIDALSSSNNSDTSCKEFADGKNGTMTLAVEIQSIRDYKIKNGKNKGKKMAYLTVSDGTASIDAVVFTEAYHLYENILYNGNLVFLFGERSDKNSFLIRKVDELI